MTDDVRTQAALSFTSEIERLTLLESEAAVEQEKLDSVSATRRKYAAAGVPDMTGEDLWKYVYTRDPQIELLFVIPGVIESFSQFKECIIEQTQVVGAKGLAVADTRQQEYADIREAIADAIEEVLVFAVDVR